jgi:hypothetical protein
MIASNNLEAKLLATNLESMVNQSASILELTSNFSEVKNTPYANSLSPIFHGIPKNADLAIRHIAQYILGKDKVIAAIFFAMPKGDVYLIEPYARQHNLTVNNLAFRDYFKGAVATHNMYLGGEIESVSAHRPTAVIAIPVYSSEKGGSMLLPNKAKSTASNSTNSTASNSTNSTASNSTNSTAASNSSHIVKSDLLFSGNNTVRIASNNPTLEPISYPVATNCLGRNAPPPM